MVPPGVFTPTLGCVLVSLPCIILSKCASRGLDWIQVEEVMTADPKVSQGTSLISIAGGGR